MGRIYKFYSPLPPGRVPDILPSACKTYDQTGRVQISLKTKWRDGRFTVTSTAVRRYTAADGWVPKIVGIGWTIGPRTDWEFHNPFCGEVHSDGRGGSILTGRFRMHLFGKVLFAVFPPLGVFSFAFLSPHNMETLVVAVIAVGLYLRHLIHACKDIDSHNGAENILRFLRENFEEVEE